MQTLNVTEAVAEEMVLGLRTANTLGINITINIDIKVNSPKP